MSKKLSKGLFVTFEGGEGSGKTTLLEKLYQTLKELDYDVIKTRAPGGTALGISIRSLVLHHQHMKICERAELLLFLTDRAQHVQEVILPALREGKIILCDRFTDSTMAYQLGARKIEEGEWLEKLCDFGCYSLKPDLTFFLSIEPKIGLARAKSAIVQEGKESFDRLESEALKFHEHVFEHYQKLASREPNRIKTIDAKKPLQEVFLAAKNHLMESLRGPYAAL